MMLVVIRITEGRSENAGREGEERAASLSPFQLPHLYQLHHLYHLYPSHQHPHHPKHIKEF